MGLVSLAVGNATTANAAELTIAFEPLSLERATRPDFEENIEESKGDRLDPSEAAKSPIEFFESLRQSPGPAPSDNKPIELQFDLPPVNSPVPPPTAIASPPAPPPVQKTPTASIPIDDSLDSLFAGDSDSLVAKAVGSAEGTRTPQGDRNPAYYGHVDPGNGAWNLGSFSYQHGASSPEEADIKQLRRLRRQAEAMLEKATAMV